MANRVTIEVGEVLGGAFPNYKLGPATLVASEDFDDARKAQKALWNAGEHAENSKNEHKKKKGSIPLDGAAYVLFKIDGGLPSDGGEHSLQFNTFQINKAAGIGPVIEVIRKEFGKKHGK